MLWLWEVLLLNYTQSPRIFIGRPALSQHGTRGARYSDTQEESSACIAERRMRSSASWSLLSPIQTSIWTRSGTSPSSWHIGDEGVLDVIPLVTSVNVYTDGTAALSR